MAICQTTVGAAGGLRVDIWQGQDNPTPRVELVTRPGQDVDQLTLPDAAALGALLSIAARIGSQTSTTPRVTRPRSNWFVSSSSQHPTAAPPRSF